MGNKCSACCRCACCTNGKSHGHVSSSGSVYTKRFVDRCDVCASMEWLTPFVFEYLVGHLGPGCGKTKQNCFLFGGMALFPFFCFVFIHSTTVDDMWNPNEIQTV